MNTHKLHYRVILIALGIFLLTNDVIAQWERLDSPNHPGLDALIRRGDTLLANVAGEIYKSNDQGNHWHKVNEGYGLLYNPYDQGVYLFRNSSTEVFGSTDFGDTWEYKFTSPTAGQLVPGFNSDTIFVSEPFRIARKTANGWDTVFTLSPSSGIINKAVRTGQHLWVATSTGAFHSSDLGESWTQLNFFDNTLAVVGDTVLFAYCTTDGYLFRTTDFGLNWQTDTLSNPRICQIGATEDEFYCVNNSSGDYNIYFSNNGLTDWDTLFHNPLNLIPRGYRKFGNKLVIASASGQPDLINGHWVFKQFPQSVPFPSYGYRRLQFFDNTLLVSTGFTGYSNSNGETWHSSALSPMVNFIKKANNGYIGIQSINDQNLYTCPYDGFFEWTKHPLPFNPQSFATIQDTIYIAESSLDLRLIYRSSDGGATWAPSGSALLGSLWALNEKLYQFGDDALMSSTDGGLSWSVVKNLGFQVNGTHRLSIENGDIYISNRFDRWVIRSTDEGQSFDTLPLPYQQGNGNGIAFRAIGNWNFLTYHNDTLFVKRKDSDQWVQLPLPLPSNELNDIFHDYLVASDSQFFFPDYYGNIWRLNASQLGEIRGCVYYDNNGNNVQDSGEKGVPNILVQSQNTGFFGVTDTMGKYHLAINRDSDILQPASTFPNFFYNPSESSVQLLDTTPVCFALQSNDTVTDLSIHLVAAGDFRPGFSNAIFANVSNLGTTYVTGTVKLVLAPLLQLNGTNPSAAAVSGDTISWSLPLLEPLSSPTTFRADVTTGFAMPGTSILLNAWVESPLDENLANNLDTLKDIIKTSFDPNDKLVRPEVLRMDEVTGTELKYTVRFQNTGNFPTDFVVLRDTLAEQIEISSIRMLGSSHAFSWSVEKSNILIFEFKPLNLPPASVDEPASHGFVSFAVRLKPGLASGQAVKNTAHIYFDYNPAIVTNTVQTVLTEKVAVSAILTKPIQIHPNPASEWVHLALPGEKDQTGRLYIFNGNGQLVMQQATHLTSVDLNLKALPAGQFWVVWQLVNQAYIGMCTIIKP